VPTAPTLNNVPVTHRAAFCAVVAAAALLLLVRGADVPLLDPDESRFARTSVEMLRSGDLVVPHFGGEPRLVKPPLVHWIQSFLFSLAGPREWVARLHAAGATLGSILLVGWLARRRFGPEGRLWAVAVFATMPLVLVPGRVGTLDALLAVHVLAVVALDLAGDETAGPYRSICTGALLGLAFLVKGPVGVVLPLLVMLAGRTAAGRTVLPSWGSTVRGLAAWAVVVLPWGLAFVRRIGVGETARTIRHEVLERYFAGTTHTEPPWFFLAVGAVGFAPWIAPLLLGLVRAWRSRRDPAAEPAVYAAAGLFVGFVFFSLGRGKVAGYVLPLAPLAALLVTWELGREMAAPRVRTAGPILLSATLAACAVLLGLAGVPRLAGAERWVAVAGTLYFAAGALVAAAGAAWRRPRLVYGAAAVSTAAFFLACAVVLFPAIGRTHSAAPLIDAVPELATRGPLATVEVRVPSLTFYLDRPVEVLEMHRLGDRLERGDAPLLVFADVDLPSIPDSVAGRLDEVGRQGKYVVFETTRAGLAPGEAELR
jgi:4-amino-4-deoxy-L-arabinose transferase-like glycosyltransferase